MGLVRFATLCDLDGCGRRSEEYTEWPACRTCDRYCCHEHSAAGSRRERDTETGPVVTCLCIWCAMVEQFDKFWAAYPRKCGKGRARRAFLGAIKKTTLEAMLAALEWQSKQSDWIKEGGKWCPHPQTWLNGERWEDEKPQSAHNYSLWLNDEDRRKLDEVKRFREDMQRKRALEQG